MDNLLISDKAKYEIEALEIELAYQCELLNDLKWYQYNERRKIESKIIRLRREIVIWCKCGLAYCFLDLFNLIKR